MQNWLYYIHTSWQTISILSFFWLVRESPICKCSRMSSFRASCQISSQNDADNLLTIQVNLDRFCEGNIPFDNVGDKPTLRHPSNTYWFGSTWVWWGHVAGLVFSIRSRAAVIRVNSTCEMVVILKLRCVGLALQFLLRGKFCSIVGLGRLGVFGLKSLNMKGFFISREWMDKLNFQLENWQPLYTRSARMTCTLVTLNYCCFCYCCCWYEGTNYCDEQQGSRGVSSARVIFFFLVYEHSKHNGIIAKHVLKTLLLFLMNAESDWQCFFHCRHD